MIEAECRWTCGVVQSLRRMLVQSQTEGQRHEGSNDTRAPTTRRSRGCASGVSLGRRGTSGSPRSPACLTIHAASR